MLFGNVLSWDEHVESCIVGEGKSDKNLVEAEIEKKPGKHEYFSHISKCNPPDVSLMQVSSDETKADPKTFFGEMPKTSKNMPSQVAGTRWKNRRLYRLHPTKASWPPTQ